jgi:3-dehydroquinate synthase
MQTYQISGPVGDSRIIVGERLERLKDYLPAGKVIVVTDHHVRQLYKDRFPSAPVISIGTGESIKTIDSLVDIYSGLLEREADRSAFLVGIGGGIVCDTAGFAASTYMRGVRFGFVASSLLAQVDAAIGGKNGVNFNGYKNLVGTITQPEFVICDPHLLQTLPETEIRCGLAEIVKHGLIGNPRLYRFMAENVEKILQLDLGVYERIIADSVAVKVAIVNRDTRETGERRILNFGHTFGHAIEKILKISHGEAVSIGMVLAAEISVRKKILPPAACENIRGLLQRLGLPVGCRAEPAQVIDAVRKDKKRHEDSIHFVLLRGIGEAVVEKVSLRELEALMPALLE